LVLPVLKSPRFLQAFRRKGRFAEMMGRIPIHLMISKVGIAGAAAYGLRRAMEGRTGAELRRAS
jgi:glucokinase